MLTITIKYDKSVLKQVQMQTTGIAGSSCTALTEGIAARTGAQIEHTSEYFEEEVKPVEIHISLEA